MATVSSLAMWFAKNSGTVEIVWLGWQISTTLSFFLLTFFILFSSLFIFFLFLRKIFLFPFKIKNKIKTNKIKKAKIALEEGLLASAYDEKEKVLISYNKAKKYSSTTPLYLLLQLQNYLIRGNEAQCFNTYKRMLDFSASRPLAIKGLILIANKNRDTELFSNMLVCAKKFKVPLEFFLFESIRFCTKNAKWSMLKELTSQYPRRLSYAGKNAISFLNFNLAKENLEEGKPEKAKKLLEEIFKKKIYFPCYIELYCNLNIEKNEKNLKKILKSYWRIFPHSNILESVFKNFNNLNIPEKTKLLIDILEGHNNLYLKYLLLGEVKAKAKVWGDSKKDLLKSIKLYPNKKAYHLLVHIEEQTSCNKNKIKNWLNLAKDCKDKLWQCKLCSFEQEEWSIYCENCNNFFTFLNQGIHNKKEIEHDLLISNKNLKIA
jgi:HemY protein